MAYCPFIQMVLGAQLLPFEKEQPHLEKRI